MADQDQNSSGARVIAVSISPGGIPKKAVNEARVDEAGLAGDGHNHEKHIRPHRAVLIQDAELLDDLRDEGFSVEPGSLGENLTVRGLRVQALPAGTRLRLDSGPLLELTEPRKPCFVLDPIHPDLQRSVEGRGGMLARVLEPGRVYPGQVIRVENNAANR